MSFLLKTKIAKVARNGRPGSVRRCGQITRPIVTDGKIL